MAGGLVLVATENDTVYAFAADSGVERWATHLAAPVDASRLPCGDISPVSGITGTPVADQAAGLLYEVAFVSPGRHVLYTLELSSGRVRAMQPADPPRDSPLVLQQRGALALAGGRVYVAYGGLFGDCGQYHGWVGGLPATGSTLAPAWFQVPGCRRECGIWAPGGPTIDEIGDLWVATGNGESSSGFDYGQSVLRLSPDLRLRDWFAPSDFASLNATDRDLGSISPALLPGGLAWISGKGGTGYLLRRDHLGHVGGQAFAGPACPSFAGTAVLGASVLLACPGSGVRQVVVDTSGPSFRRGWLAPIDAPGAPIVAFGAVWVIATGSGTLTALDPASGRALFSTRGPSATGRAMHFATPAAGSGRVYAALERDLVAVAVTEKDAEGTQAPPANSPS